jgi:alpha-tubulin suppressor-like RCC1 family protein
MNSRQLVVSLALFAAACGTTPPPDPVPDAGVPDPDAGVPGDGGTAAPLTDPLSAGIHHTCGFSADGKTWCWGRNQYGELGTAGNPSPVPVQARISQLVDVKAGKQSTCGIKDDGTLWCWGRILSDDEDDLRSPPQQITAAGTDFRQLDMAEEVLYALKQDGSIWTHHQGTTQKIVEGGATQFSVFYEYSVCFVRSDKTLWCQGDNSNGILGNGTTDSSAVPVQVAIPASVQQVSLGGNFACALTTAGEVWCWGSNETAQTGTRQSTHECSWSGAGPLPCNPAPVKINGLPGPAKAISTGYDYTLALLTDGTIWGWGGNYSLELGAPSSETCTSILGTNPCSPTPLKAPVEGMATLSAGSDHSCGCDKDGAAWCWGSKGDGKLGSADLPATGSAHGPIKLTGFRCR